MPVGSKKQKQFCAIGHWIEAHDTQLYEAMQRMCMVGALSPGRNNNPITFVHPDNKTKEEIISASYEDLDKATSLILAHILPFNLTSGNDFATYKSELGSKNGNLLKVISATDVEVVLGATGKGKGEAKLTPVGIKAKRPIAVWKVTSGSMPLDGDPFNWKNSKRKVARGGAYYGGRPTSARATIASHLESQMANLLKSDEYMKKHPYASAMVGLILHLRDKFPAELKQIALLLDYDPVASFYIAVQPYKTNGTCLLSDQAITTWDGKSGFGSVGKSYASLLKETVDDVFKDPSIVPMGKFNAAIDSLRSAIEPDLRAPGVVKAAFDMLNTKFDGKLFPAEIPGDQMRWNDELRYLVGSLVLDFPNIQPAERVSKWNRMTLMLSTVRPGNDFAKETTLTNPDHFRNNVNPTLSHQNTMSLINSTDFGHRGISDLPVGGGVVATTPADFDYTVGGMASFSGSKKKMLLSMVNTDIGQSVLKEYIKTLEGPVKDSIKALLC